MRWQYWLRIALRNLGSILLASTIYSTLLCLMNSDFIFPDVPTLWPLCVVLFGGFMQLFYGITLLRSVTNLALSMGETRRGAFLGLILATLVPALGSALLAAMVAALADYLGAEQMLPLGSQLSLTIGFGLLLSAVGLLIAMIQHRFGNIAGVLVAVAAVVLGMGVSMAAGFGLLDPILGWGVLLAGAVCYGIVLIPLRRTVYRFAVKL